MESMESMKCMESMEHMESMTTMESMESVQSMESSESPDAENRTSFFSDMENQVLGPPEVENIELKLRPCFDMCILGLDSVWTMFRPCVRHVNDMLRTCVGHVAHV